MFRLPKFALMSALLCTGAAWPVFGEATHLEAPSEEQRVEARHRLALAEEQRALVEEMSEAACIVALGIDVEKHVSLLGKVRDRFSKVMTGLREGDTDLGLSSDEHYSKVIRALDGADAAWDVYRPAVDVVIETGGVPDTAKEPLFEGDKAVLDALGRLVSRIESAYADPATVTMAKAITVDVVARQEMITQAIGKDVCLVVLGWNVEQHRETLSSWLSIFGASHQALTEGAPGMGIPPAPTPEIEAALSAFWEQWVPQQDVAERVLAGQEVDRETLESFFATNLRLLEDLAAIVKMYEAV